ncbi:hypothetical protein LTS12_009553 [Elasticomyces elasticus]|nr:hypothetical protein LTS12_009553 [Elasticomyces elasticus]
MAEIFGVAAGAVGIAGFAVQLAESLKKLQNFAARVKNARTELDELIESLGLSQQWLDRVKNTSNPAAGIDPKLMIECERLCRRAVDNIKVVTDQLEIRMRTRKLRTSVKFAWDTEELGRLRKKLEISKADLHYAHSVYTAEQIRFENSDQGRQGREMAEHQHAEAHARHQTLKQSLLNVQTGQIMVQQTIDTGQQANQQSFTQLQTVQLAQQQNFASLQVGQADIQRTLHTGQMQFRQDLRVETTLVTNRLDANHAQTTAQMAMFKRDILDAVNAQSGAVHALHVSPGTSLDTKQSFKRQRPRAESRQQALPRQVEWARQYQLRLVSRVWHITLCHAWAGWDFSLRTYSIIPAEDERWKALSSPFLQDVQRTLAERAISPYDQDEDGWTPMDYIMCLDRDASFLQRMHEVWIKVNMPLVFGTNLRGTLQGLWTADRKCSSTLEQGALMRTWLKLLSTAADLQEEVMETLEKQPCEWTTEQRFQILYWLCDTEICDVMTFDILAGFDLNSSLIATLQTVDGFTMMHALAYACVDSSRTRDEMKRLEELLRTCVQGGANLHARHGSSATPLRNLIFKYSLLAWLQREPPGVPSTEAIRPWARSLYLAGVDLELHGRAEMDELRQLRNWSERCSRFILTYGPEVTDWDILEMHPGDSYAGVFWHTVEHPAANIPGAWQEDEDQTVQFEDKIREQTAEVKAQRKARGARKHEESRMGLDKLIDDIYAGLHVFQ